MNTTQVFTLNIPAEFTTSNTPDLHVTCKVERREDGSQSFLEFIDLKTITVCFVRDWLKVHALAVKRADVLWHSNNSLHEAHAVQLNDLIN